MTDSSSAVVADYLSGLNEAQRDAATYGSRSGEEWLGGIGNMRGSSPRRTAVGMSPPSSKRRSGGPGSGATRIPCRLGNGGGVSETVAARTRSKLPRSHTMPPVRSKSWQRTPETTEPEHGTQGDDGNNGEPNARQTGGRMECGANPPFRRQVFWATRG